MKIAFQACPLCAAPDPAPYLEADCTKHPGYRPPLPPVMRWMRCGSCGHIFTDGHWTKEALEIVFATVQDGQKVGQGLEAQRYVSARMIERVLAYKSAGRWLDVGFGNGSLIFTAREFGFEAVGLDLRAQGVSSLRKIGIEAHCCNLTDFNPDSSFDVISMADVLEHMPHPKEGLAAASRLLAPGGVLLVSMPNMDCDLWKAMDAAQANPYWAEIEHYHNFGRIRLHGLLREFGFEPVRYAVSERYRACMEVLAIKAGSASDAL